MSIEPTVLIADCAGKRCCFSIVITWPKIFGQSIACSSTVEFLLHKQACFVGYTLFGVPDVNHPTGIRSDFHRCPKGIGSAGDFDDDIGSVAVRPSVTIRKNFRYRQPLQVNGTLGAGFAGGRQRGIADTEPDDHGSRKAEAAMASSPTPPHPKTRTVSLSVTSARATAWQPTVRSSTRQGSVRLISCIELFDGNGDPFGEGAVALRAKCLVVLTRVASAVPARGHTPQLV